MDGSPRHVFERFIGEAFNGGNVRVLNELISTDHVSHLPSGDHYGPEGVRIDIATFRGAFPDLELVINEVIESDDLLVCRYTIRGTHQGQLLGIAPSDHRVRIDAICIERFSDGKMAERWVQYDGIGLLQQVGAIPGFVAAVD
jgi:predicted ester cyclase